MTRIGLFVLFGVAAFASWADDDVAEAVIGDDWAYELPSQAKERYLRKVPQVQCSEISIRLKKGEGMAVYIAIRDAGLFRDKSCSAEIRKNYDALMVQHPLRDAVLFYRSAFGDKVALREMVTVFDRERKQMPDHPMVMLFGYLPDWELTGRRLARVSGTADGAAAEQLCSALKWRRFLYGEESFASHWFSVGEKEHIDRRALEYDYHRCYAR